MTSPFDLLLGIALIIAALMVLGLLVGVGRLAVSVALAILRPIGWLVATVAPGVKVCTNCGRATTAAVYCPSCNYSTLQEADAR